MNAGSTLSANIRRKMNWEKAHEALCRKIIDKCPTLINLHPIVRQGVIKAMKFVTLNKGEKFLIKRWPRIDFFVIVEGRLSLRWYEILDEEEWIDEEVFYIRDYLDQHKLKEFYTGNRIVDDEAIAISEHCKICTIDQHIYEEHFRMNQFFAKKSFYDFVLLNMFTLKNYGLQVKKRVMEGIKFLQCMRGEVLAPEGVEADKIYMVVKGKLRIYRKIINDEVRDSNSRRQDMRLIN